MVQVVWTRRAVGDLIAIRNYIGAFNPTAAGRLSRKLEVAGDSLAESPERGVSTGGGYRQLAAVRPYLLRYRIRLGVVEIVTVRHSARSPVR